MMRPAAACLVLLAFVAPSFAQNRAPNGGEVLSDGTISFGTDLPKLGRREGNKTVITPDTLQILGPGSTGDTSAMSYIVAKPGAVARTLASRMADQISVKDFGAVCDGTADDTSGFQKAITRLAAGDVPGLYVPSGSRCRVSSALSATLTTPATIWGAGMGDSEIAFTGASAGFTFNVPDRGKLNIVGLTIKRDVISPAHANTGVRVNAATMSNVVNVDKVEFRGLANDMSAWSVGLALKNTVAATVRGSRFHMTNGAFEAPGAGPVGIELTGTSVSIFGVDTKISDAMIQGGNIGIRIGGYVQGVFVTNTEAIGLDYGVYWDAPGTLGEYLTVSNTHINAGIKGIYQNGIGQSLINNNLFLRFDAHRSSLPWAAVDNVDSHNLTITANQIYGSVKAPETGIAIVANDGSGAQPNSVTGNSIAGIAGRGISTGGTVSGASITGNSMNGVLGGGIIQDPLTSWAPSRAYAINKAVLSGGATYVVKQAGTSAARGGPTGTGDNIVDGGVIWRYSGPSPVGTNAVIGNTLNGRPDITISGDNIATTHILPRQNLSYVLGAGQNIWSQAWINQLVLSSGGIASVLSADTRGNVNVNAPTLASKTIRATEASVLPAYTVAQLQGAVACSSGRRDWLVVVTDAANPTYRSALTGGGSVRTLAYCDGTSWTAH
ncbi:glycosyl hydrolase family 28-related protein [Methylorubrum sp. SL192]|uniref:glycosyl hydrolase family 28-related protein n=1 Tax=Methylorubrum sp. SL192 TaxID=2995167 RepID=UPI002275B16C|nr:glycosyl hydrolase family 28-related protein [Methylorubrum sp. SL192]MCY1643266.1 glycosyl hydrolase family 28-related protein [Methylorubrum sp. SL192]